MDKCKDLKEDFKRAVSNPGMKSKRLARNLAVLSSSYEMDEVFEKVDELNKAIIPLQNNLQDNEKEMRDLCDRLAGLSGNGIKEFIEKNLLENLEFTGYVEDMVGLVSCDSRLSCDKETDFSFQTLVKTMRCSEPEGKTM